MQDNKKIYVLMKDLPNLKSGSEGRINDNGLLCFTENYIIQNKPCLSLNDLIQVWDVNTISRSEITKATMYKRFEQLVKDKIQK